MKVGKIIKHQGRYGIVAGLPEHKPEMAVCWFGNEFRRSSEILPCDKLMEIDSSDDVPLWLTPDLLAMAQALIDKILDDKKIF